MKIARTWTIDYDLYLQLKKKHNQSSIVNKSIRRYLSNNDETDIADIETLRLLAALHAREEINPILKSSIMEQIHILRNKR